MRYSIPEENMELLQKKLSRIEKKCAKYEGCTFKFETIGEHFEEIEEDDGSKSIVKYIDIDVEGTAIVNGYQFIATVEHTPNGNIIRRFNTDENLHVPERYFSTEPICEHCNTKRRRKDTYLVYHAESDTWKQVGATCLNDYTHGVSAELAASLATYIRSVEEYESRGFSGASYKSYLDPKTMLALARESVSHFGYNNSQADHPTKVQVSNWFNYLYHRRSMMKDEIRDIESLILKYNLDIESAEENHKQYVEDALAWITSIEPTSEYERNLQTVAKLPYIEYRDLGILVSLTVAYDRHLGYVKKQQEKEEAHNKLKGSEYQGELKQRITIDVESARVIYTYTTQYGLVVVYEIIDTNKNVYIWKCSSYVEDITKVTKLIGTVKDHKEYKGVRQTELTRCRVLEEVA